MSQIPALESDIKAAREYIAELEAENKRLRHDLDNIKIRSYELGQRELHDMALAPLKEKGGANE